MRREQGYNIYKIRAVISYFDNTFVGHTKIWWPKLHPHFFKFDFFLIKDDLRKLLKSRPFCREKHSLSFELFRASNHQTMNEKIATYDQNWKKRFLGNLKKCHPCYLLIDQSEGVHIWVFIVTFYDLSNDRTKFKIWNVAAADMVGMLADPLLRVST
jgi:hypothetical protein